MAAQLPDAQIMIPYKQLMELLEVAAELPKLRKENHRLQDQVLALRITQMECMEKIKQLEKLL